MLDQQLIRVGIILRIHLRLNHWAPIFIMIIRFLLLHLTTSLSTSIFQICWWSLLLERASFLILRIQRWRLRLVLHCCLRLWNRMFGVLLLIWTGQFEVIISNHVSDVLLVGFFVLLWSSLWFEIICFLLELKHQFLLFFAEHSVITPFVVSLFFL